MKKSENMLSFPDPRNENWMKKRQNMLSFLTQEMKIG